MNQRRVSDATMRVRDVLYDGLRGVLPEEVARERANNLSMAAVEALAQLAEESKPPPVRYPVACKLNNGCALDDGHADECEGPPF